MAPGNNSKKAVPPAEKKQQLDDDDRMIRRQTEEFNEWLDKMESMDRDELKEYTRQNKAAFCSQKKATINKVMQKGKQKKRRRSIVSPILGAVLKFHKDDDMDPPPPGVAS